MSVSLRSWPFCTGYAVLWVMQSLSVPLLPSTQTTTFEPQVRAQVRAEVRDDVRSFVGGTRFVSNDDAPRTHEALGGESALVVQVCCEERGRLMEKIEARIETELAARGASAPGMGSDDAMDTLLSDQLFRARKLGHRGLCVSIVGLERLAASVGGLDAIDARALRFYATASRERPVALLLRDSDRALVAFVSPISLVDLLEMGDRSPEPPRAVAPEPKIDLAFEPEQVQREMDAAEPEALEPEPLVAEEPASMSLADAILDPPVMRAVPNVAFKPWVAALHAARGPQPLGSFERIFAQSYMPLANAIANGLNDANAIAARDEFSRTFARSYTDACPTFAVTGKRPKMVLDSHDLAKRFARMHGARTTHLVLVDAMRWDVGAMVRDGLVSMLTGRATLAVETPLFSALPTVTSRQLEGLTRGIDALRLAHDVDRDADPVRGRTAEMIRRVKVGSRDVFKLDVIEAGLAKAQAHALEVLPELANHAADAIAKHIATLAPRTLVFVFGDHGFVVDEEGVAHQGGAAPEEVIVPSFAFLTTELH